jgi:DNA-binding response OmpR family regulator
MSDHWTTRPTRVLLAEDNPEFRAMLAEALREEGLEVAEAEDGHALLDMLAEALSSSGDLCGVDLVVSDIRMPGYSALDVLTGARRALSHTPVILMTAFGDPATHDTARHLGAAVVLDKPFSVDEFVTHVRRLCPP